MPQPLIQLVDETAINKLEQNVGWIAEDAAVANGSDNKEEENQNSCCFGDEVKHLQLQRNMLILEKKKQTMAILSP